MSIFPLGGGGVTGPPLLLRHGASGSAVSSVGPSKLVALCEKQGEYVGPILVQ